MVSYKVYKPDGKIKETNYTPASHLKDISFALYSLNSKHIVGRANAQDTTNTIYTVPVNYTLFVTTLTLSVRNQNSGGTIPERGEVNLNGKDFLFLYSTQTEGDVQDTSVSFSIPFKLNSGQKIQIESKSAGGWSYGSFSGFLVKNSDLKY